MSKADRDFVDSLSISYANLAGVLGISRQAVSRGVQRSDTNYFTQSDLARILVDFESKDPFEYQLAKQSIANLYPETAAEIFRLLDARNGSDFDESLPAEFSLVTADFVTFMKEMKACRRQFESIVQKLPTESGLLTIVVNKKDGERALKYRKNIEISNKLDQRKLEQRILVTECDIDLSILPTCMLRVGDDFTVSIYMASENGFIPLNSYEANRIKQQIESVQFNGITH